MAIASATAENLIVRHFSASAYLADEFPHDRIVNLCHTSGYFSFGNVRYAQPMMTSSDGLPEGPQSMGPSRRSRSGCWTCRSRTVKKRCDQERPACGRCVRLELICDYAPRPSLAERRRAQKSVDLSRADSTYGSVSSPPTMCMVEAQSSLSLIELEVPGNAACSVYITNAGHEAIRHFRSGFAKHHQVKDTSYSLISLMFKVAQEDPMVMDMVIAIGMQETNFRRRTSQSTGKSNSLVHYSSALRQLADGILPGASMKSPDVLYTTLWMMLYYEQQFGDPLCATYTQHLKGISSLLQNQHASQPNTAASKGLWGDTDAKQEANMTVYSARVLVWISCLDAAAASSGIGGQVITAILDTLLPRKIWSEGSSADTVQAVTKFHRFSGPLYRMAWGDSYPESEILNDLEDREAYSLLAACVQLRFLTARLTTLRRIDASAAARKAFDVEQSINQVRDSFCDFISLASNFAWEQDHSKRLVANVCAVVPMYYAVVLDFFRSTIPDLPKSERQLHALNEIMNLLFQGYEQGGDEAMIKVAWALFTAALETDDMIHRAWILERFAAISKYGRNLERAHDFLLKYIPIQQQVGKRVDLREEMEKMPKFVLG